MRELVLACVSLFYPVSSFEFPEPRWVVVPCASPLPAQRSYLQNAVNTAKKCCAERWAVVLSVLLLLWLARVLRGPCFFRVGF